VTQCHNSTVYPKYLPSWVFHHEGTCIESQKVFFLQVAGCNNAWMAWLFPGQVNGEC
jgi:hypothetical protein